MEWTIRDSEGLKRLFHHLGNMPHPFRCTVVKGEDRSKAQNALLHKWYGEIASQRGDMTALQVKGECHRKYGLAIRLREPQFAWVWENTGAKMSYEKQCKFLTSGILNVSSGMTVEQLSEYMNDMSRDYRQDGYQLTDPELWRATA